MTQYIDKAAVVAEIKKRKKEWQYGSSVEAKYKKEECDDILSFLDTIEVKEVKEEPVSEDLEEASEQLAENARKHKAETSSPFFSQTDYRQGVMDGVKWQKENLWKLADGEDLPEYDREVIVLTQPYPLEGSEFAVSFAHRPYPKGWDGKSITTGQVEHYTPKTYNKGGWNIPNVKYWLDIGLPKDNEAMKELDELKEKCVQAMKDVDAFVDEHYEELCNEIREQWNVPEDWIVKIVSNCGVVHGCYRQTDKDEWFRVIYNNGFWLDSNFL